MIGRSRTVKASRERIDSDITTASVGEGALLSDEEEIGIRQEWSERLRLRRDVIHACSRQCGYLV
jgi:hypothetical protein